ncbi:MAG: hypothetical protein KatS3mg109_0597 [Pirellulaceae bacterium]|nr:MAG: hypothetical protein KatS3mg109_0597 [Pirellulaceae bacterium]
MRPETDPSHMAADERLHEVAGILAAGVLRLHSRMALPAHAQDSGPEKPPEPGKDCLEVPGKTVLSVHTR